MTALSGAREIRVPLADGDVHDLDAMAEEITAATQIVVVCNPNNPTGTHLPSAEIGAFLDKVPDHVTVILDEAYCEFSLAVEDYDSTIALMPDYPNLVLLRTFSKCYGLAGLRVGYALCSPQFRAAVDAVRQPFSVNAIAQAAGAEAILHQDDVATRVERNIVERMFVEDGVRELGLSTPDSQANFSWVELGDHEEAEVIDSLSKAGVAVRAGTPLGGPGPLPRHIRDARRERALSRRPGRRDLGRLRADTVDFGWGTCYKLGQMHHSGTQTSLLGRSAVISARARSWYWRFS